MARGKKAEPKEDSKHMSHEGQKHTTHASGEQKKSHLMDGIVSGLPRKILPPTIDGIVRGIQKHQAHSLSADTMKMKSSPTSMALGDFGAGQFPQGKY
jgi:hypothetical protein